VNGRRTTARAAGLMLGLLAVAALPAEAANLYRYRNAQGVLVIDNTMPASAAAGGYEILSPDGKVLEKVVPGGEKSQAGEPGKSMPVRSEHQEKIDRYLLSSYSSVADIDAVKTRRLQEVEHEINDDQVRIADLERQRTALEDSAADVQRSGKPVPPKLLGDLKVMDRRLEQTRDHLAERERQHTEVEQLYAQYSARFTELKAARPGPAGPPAQTAPAPATAPPSAP
jgi:hypothetical protein